VNLADLQVCAAEHLDRYMTDRDHRAFHTYDRLGDPDVLSPLDCLAPVLLSLRMTYAEVIPMFADNGPHADLRAAIQAVLDDPSLSGRRLPNSHAERR
jgi:hypothetical protein